MNEWMGNKISTLNPYTSYKPEGCSLMDYGLKAETGTPDSTSREVLGEMRHLYLL
jgi:hypothetical protein